MSSDSNVSVIFNSDGYEATIYPNLPIPLDTPTLLMGGNNSGTAQVIALNSSGAQLITGEGTAGSPDPGILTVQGISGGTPITISGTVTAANPSVSSNGSAIPSSSTLVGFTDGTNLQPSKVFDTNSGAGTEYVLGVNLRGSGTSGSLELGTSSNPLRIDPTGTTIQPVSATSLPLPTGASTETTLSSLNNKFSSLGQKISTNSAPVVLASDQSAIPVSQSGSWTVLSNIGTTGGLALDSTLSKLTVSQSTALGSNTQILIGGSVSTSAPSYSTGNINPLSLTTIGALRVDGSSTTQPVSGTLTVNQGTNPWATDITDRATRLLGVIYGSRGQQLLQTATNFNTQVEIAVDATLIDPRQIRSLTSSDIITANAGSGIFNITGTGTAGSSASGIVSVQGIAGGTALPISGSITATNASIGSNSSVIPTSSTQIGGSVSTAAPTYINGNLNPLSLTISGALRVDGSSVVQPISATSLPLPTGASTAAKQPTLGTAGTASTDVITVQGIASMTALKVDGSATTQPVSGTITANAGTGNFTVVQATASNLNANVSGTITANIGTTNGLALDASVNSLLVAQGSTTSGEKGTLIQGAVSTVSPTYTTAQTNPLSLTTAGALRVDASASTQPVSGTVAATQSGSWTIQPGNTPNTTPWLVTDSADGSVAPGTVATKSNLIGGQFNSSLPSLTTAQQAAIQVDSSARLITVGSGVAGTPVGGVLSVQGVSGGTALPVSLPSDLLPATQNITIQDTASTSTPVANGGAFITGTPTVGSTATFSYSSFEAIKVQVTGTWTGTLTLESSLDSGTTWFSSGIHQSGTSYTTNNFTGNFIGGLNVSGTTNFRVRATAAMTGTATVKVNQTANINSLYIVNPIKLSDATVQSVQNTIKAASTAATTTDTALVVAVSPNTSVPTFQRASTATESNVASSASSVTLLASNTARLGATIFNDSTSQLYVKLGTTASITSYTVLVNSNGYYEVPFGFNNRIDGIWSAAVGSARITEITA